MFRIEMNVGSPLLDWLDRGTQKEACEDRDGSGRRGPKAQGDADDDRKTQKADPAGSGKDKGKWWDSPCRNGQDEDCESAADRQEALETCSQS